MAEFLEDPSVLTKDKLKSELTANNVPLPFGENKKEVYIQLYLNNLTVLNNKTGAAPTDTFSSDDELPTPVVSNRSRSGRKAIRKTDKPRTEEVEVVELTDAVLKEQLSKHGVDAGPIVDSTRKLYEKKLQKVLEQQAPAETLSAPGTATALSAPPKADSNHNGDTHSDQYSDKEDEETPAPEPEPVPIVERLMRSRGKIPVTVRTSSRRQTKLVEETLAGGDQTPKKTGENIEDILANEIGTPTGISASCRRPIRGAAGRPVKPSEYWLDESLLQRSVHTESHSYSESLSRIGGGGSLGKASARQGVLSMLLRLLLLVVVAGSLYYAYQNLGSEQIDVLNGLLDSVVIPLQGLANNAAVHLQGMVDGTTAYLGIGSSSAAEGTGAATAQ